MLKFRWYRVAPDIVSEPTPSVAATNPDLQIRDLLDDPRLRAAVGDAGALVLSVSTLPARIPGEALSSALRQGVRERAAA